jgi:hypothetical protein
MNTTSFLALAIFAPRDAARFSLLKGTLNNVDLVRTIQSPSHAALSTSAAASNIRC